MTKRQKPPIRSSRSELALILVLSIELMCVASQLLGGSEKERFWEKADVSDVVKTVRRHRGAMLSEAECEQLIRLNLKHLYFNALDTDRFIGMPKPDRVLERMSKVFSLAEELRLALSDARLLCEQRAELTDLRRSAKRIHDCAAGIHSTFHDFFKEDTTGSLSADIAAVTDGRVRFADYVSACERISTLLDQELERYFLNPTPGIVEVSTFRSCSIPVLSLRLERLSLSFEKSPLD